MSLPLDPVGGRPARRHLRTIPTAALRRYWWIWAGDLKRLYDGVQEIQIYESEDGLLFTWPLIEGDSAFYTTAYRRLGMPSNMTRDEHARTAALVGKDDRILDVGCNDGAFGSVLNGRGTYVGIDTSTYKRPGTTLDIRRETLADHVAQHGPTYDLVAAFHILEHVADPVHFARLLCAATRPGGRVVIALPLPRSKMLEIPAFPPNLPPHHLTVWTQNALRQLAAKVGLEVERIDEDILTPAEDIVLWLHHNLPLKVPEPAGFARLDRAALGSLARGFFSSRLKNWSRPYPRGPGDSFSQVMVARKPG